MKADINILGTKFNPAAFVGFSETKFVKMKYGTKEQWEKLKDFIPKKATKKE